MVRSWCQQCKGFIFCAVLYITVATLP